MLETRNFELEKQLNDKSLYVSEKLGESLGKVFDALKPVPSIS
jgi:hypothetical protein